jgi:hypothetical protein
MIEHSNDEPAPLNLAELKYRLIYGGPGGLPAQGDNIRELLAYGAAARPLVPVVVEQYRAGKYQGAFTSLLVELYLTTKDASLLAALRERGALARCNFEDISRLFESGVVDLEGDLLGLLWDSWKGADKPERRRVVQALGKCGGPGALEMLEVIRAQLAGKVQEDWAKVDSLVREGPYPAVEVTSLRANETFLEEVRKAIQELTKRQSAGG